MIYIEACDHMEMPAPCSRCGEVQELNDYRSRPGETDLVCDDCWESQDITDDVDPQDPDEYHDALVDRQIERSTYVR